MLAIRTSYCEMGRSLCMHAFVYSRTVPGVQVKAEEEASKRNVSTPPPLPNSACIMWGIEHVCKLTMIFSSLHSPCIIGRADRSPGSAVPS